jgi:opacity protein-like surface antigen
LGHRLLIGVAFANTHSDSSFAWAINAGLSYDVTQNFTIDLAYRYLDIGDAESGTVHPDNGGSFPATGFDNVHSSDIMLAARYKFGCCGAQAPMPISYK